MVEAVHLRSVLTNTGLIDRVQQTQQEQQNQNLRHAIQEDLKEFANQRDAVNLTKKIENKIIVKDESGNKGAKGQEQNKSNEEQEKNTDQTEKQEEGSIIDIHV